MLSIGLALPLIHFIHIFLYNQPEFIEFQAAQVPVLRTVFLVTAIIQGYPHFPVFDGCLYPVQGFYQMAMNDPFEGFRVGMPEVLFVPEHALIILKRVIGIEVKSCMDE